MIDETSEVTESEVAEISAVVEKAKRGRKIKVKKERKQRVVRSIIAAAPGPMAGQLFSLISAFPADIKSITKAREWAKGQALHPEGFRSITFLRVLGSFKATPQTVMKYEVE